MNKILTSVRFEPDILKKFQEKFRRGEVSYHICQAMRAYPLINEVEPVAATLPKVVKANKEVSALSGIGVEVIGHLNIVAGRKFRPSKSAVKVIHARMNEGYCFDDFKVVIEKKCMEWLGTEFERYLQPSTLFGAKFDQYLNQVIVAGGSAKRAEAFKPVHDHQKGFLGRDVIDGETDG